METYFMTFIKMSPPSVEKNFHVISTPKCQPSL